MNERRLGGNSTAQGAAHQHRPLDRERTGAYNGTGLQRDRFFCVHRVWSGVRLLHKYSNLDIQVRVQDWKSKVFTLQDLQYLIWGF